MIADTVQNHGRQLPTPQGTVRCEHTFLVQSPCKVHTKEVRDLNAPLLGAITDCRHITFIFDRPPTDSHVDDKNPLLCRLIFSHTLDINLGLTQTGRV